MNIRNISSPGRGNLVSPKTSPNAGSQRGLDLPRLNEEDEKALHVAEINAKYHKRLIKPLQINQRIRFQNEMGSYDFSKQLHLQKYYTPSNEDAEKRYLIDKVKELTKISALHDKETGLERLKSPLKKTKKKENILQQHLEANLYSYIKEVNEKVEKSKKTNIHEARARSLDAPKDKARGSISAKDPKETVQKQLEAMREIQDKKVIPKQLNANNFFRHSQRKLLYLRTMESTDLMANVDDMAESFFRKEAEKEKERLNFLKKGLYRHEALSSQKSLHLRQKSSQGSPINGSNKMTQSALLLRESQSLASPLSSQNQNFNYKSYNLIGGFRDPNNDVIEPQSEFSNLLSFGLTPTELRSEMKTRSQPHNTRILSEGDTPLKPKSGNLRIRTPTQALTRGRRKLSSISHASEKGEVDSNLNPVSKINNLDTQRSIVDEEEPKKENDNDDNDDDNENGNSLLKELPKPEGPEGAQTFYKRLTGIKLKDKFYLPSSSHGKKVSQTQETGPDDLNLLSPVTVMTVATSDNKRIRDNLRANLLSNMKKAREIQNTSGGHDSSYHEMSMSAKKWPVLEGEPHTVNKMRITRLKSPEIGVKKKKKAKKNKNNLSKSNFFKNGIQTEPDHEVLVRGISEEKVPIKEEVQNIYTRYGYKDIMLDIKRPKLKVTRKVKDLFESINKDNIAKVEKFLQRTYLKTMKTLKVD